MRAPELFPRGFRRAAHERVGRRGAILFALGVADVVYGISLSSTNGAAQNATIRWFSTMGPLWMWSWLWILVGVLCLISCVHLFEDLPAFFAALVLKLWWVILCFVGWLAGEVSLGAPGLFFGFAVFVYVITGWSEPPDQVQDGS